jgi:hypothetical protein
MICSEIYNNFDFYEDQLKLQGMNIGIKWFMVEPYTCCKFGCCGVIFCEWSFSIFIFLELLAFKLLGGG